MKTVLITGCSSGIGLSTALAFARKGFHVIATMRNLDKSHALQQLAATEKLSLDIRQLDIAQDHAIQTFVKTLLNDYPTIDILINNAGAGYLGTLEQTTLAQAQDIMNVNFFGVWSLTKAILPSMRANQSGHIISITSIGGVIGQPFNDAYCAAKFAVEGMMESLAPVLKRLNIHVSLVQPGPVNSEFVSSTLDKSTTLPTDLEQDYKCMLDAYMQATQEAYAQLAQSPDEIAHVIIDIATSASPCLRYQTSAITQKLAAAKLMDITGNQVLALSGSRLPATIKP